MSNELYALNWKPWIDAAKELIRFDEVERALSVLENVPAVYRDNPIEEIEKLKRDIKAACITAHAYMSSTLDADVTVEKAVSSIEHLLRAKVLDLEVRLLNEAGETPHIVDLGPGEYWAPIGLKSKGRKFSYKAIAMDSLAAQKAKPLMEGIPDTKADGAPTVFVANEVIEHLPSPGDLAIEALRYCGDWPDYVHISTPRYTYDCAHKDWNKPCGLPHLRAYTPKEFILEVGEIFPGYSWEYTADLIQSVRGFRIGSKGKAILSN